MAEYEDCEVKYDHNYENVYTKSNITKETFSSRKQWIKIVILVMTVSLVCSVLGVTITYLLMRGELCCKKKPSNSSATVDQQISIMSKKLDMIQMKSEKFTQQAKLGELCCKSTQSDSSTTVNQQILIISNKVDTIQRKTETLTMKTKLVAFTACLSADTTVQRGHNIQFGDIKTSYGVGSLTELKSSGRFTTRDYGLYQVIAIVKSHTDAAAFTVNRNNANIMAGYVAQHNDRGVGTNFDHIGIAVVMVFLYKGDTISVTPDIEVFLHKETCLSMVKI